MSVRRGPVQSPGHRDLGVRPDRVDAGEATELWRAGSGAHRASDGHLHASIWLILRRRGRPVENGRLWGAVVAVLRSGLRLAQVQHRPAGQHALPPHTPGADRPALPVETDLMQAVM